MKKDPLPWWFEEVAAEAVRASALQAVTHLLAFVRHDLRLRSVSVRWFRHRKGTMPPGKRTAWGNPGRVDMGFHWLNYSNHPQRLSGLALKKASLIWLRATMRPGTLIRTAAHEARHIWQFRNWSDKRNREGPKWEIEMDAARYADRVCRRLGFAPVTSGALLEDAAFEMLVAGDAVIAAFARAKRGRGG